MRRDDARSLAIKLGAQYTKIISLPIKGRNIKKLIKKLEFFPCIKGYCLIICKELSCQLCWLPRKLEFKIIRVKQKDILSNLTHIVPKLVGQCCNFKVVVGEWKGSVVEISSINCPATIEPDSVDCLGSTCPGDIAKCLDECSILIQRP